MIKIFVIVLLFYDYLSDYAVSASIGDKFHEDTSHTWTRIFKDTASPKSAMPSSFKEYKGSKIILPKPNFKGISLEETIIKRRSIREYIDMPLSLAEVSQLVFSAQGITGRRYGNALRTAPSAGALYPFEIYLFINNVNGLKRGLYHYSPPDHCIVLIREGDFRKELMQASLSQKMTRDAGIVIVLSAIFDRTKSKYGERGLRYVYMEAGHISQNIYLQAASLGLGSVVIGAFIDKDINNLIGVDGKEEAVITLHTVGTIKNNSEG